ncbi:hypothetical protein TIFTF001_032241 [Ficus carica]|uniref:Uncharacterized protein n=1 Tax=Ficus carica TaxID=3494 RepID=A0AA88E358_FICCA|nr:hypothetical protein TIFTF001_032241 [Ficus carica]
MMMMPRSWRKFLLHHVGEAKTKSRFKNNAHKSGRVGDMANTIKGVLRGLNELRDQLQQILYNAPQNGDSH